MAPHLQRQPPNLVRALEFTSLATDTITHITRICMPHCVTLRSAVTGLLVPDTAS